MRGDSNDRLTILSEAEKTALYGSPDFDDFQRIELRLQVSLKPCTVNLALRGNKQGADYAMHDHRAATGCK